MHRLIITTALFFCSLAHALQESTYHYKEELENFKKSPQYELIFNEDTHPIVRGLNRDIENYKELTNWQRITRFGLLTFAVVVTADAMPKLYACIDGVCNKSRIAMPTVFVTVDKGFFNAAAIKLLKSTGAIVIGQKMIYKTNDRQLEAIIAHEIGHIKHDHINKTLELLLPTAVIIQALKYCILNRFRVFPESNKLFYWAVDISLTWRLAAIITNLMLNKKFEKEADEFAYGDMGKGEGLIEFFDLLQEKELQTDADFIATYVKLQENESEIEPADYAGLKFSFYVARGIRYLENAYRWFYYNTRYGAHPSPQARSATIQKYLEEQVADEEIDTE